MSRAQTTLSTQGGLSRGSLLSRILDFTTETRISDIRGKIQKSVVKSKKSVVIPDQNGKIAERDLKHLNFFELFSNFTK